MPFSEGLSSKDCNLPTKPIGGYKEVVIIGNEIQCLETMLMAVRVRLKNVHMTTSSIPAVRGAPSTPCPACGG